MRVTKADILVVKNGIRIDECINMYIIGAKKEYYGCGTKISDGHPIKCPLHFETKASFYFREQQKRFKCFGCNCGGDIIDLYILWNKANGRKIDFVTAVIELRGCMENGRLPKH